METAAFIAAALVLVVAGFQLALAFGAPWGGAAAWGGRHPGVLPTPYRVASGIVGLFFYPAVILIVLGAAGLMGGDANCMNNCLLVSKSSAVGLWVLAELFAVGALVNFVSPSKVEGRWGPVSLVIAGCCPAIALG